MRKEKMISACVLISIIELRPGFIKIFPASRGLLPAGPEIKITPAKGAYALNCRIKISIKSTLNQKADS